MSHLRAPSSPDLLNRRTPEQFVLWAFRTWVRVCAGETDRQPILRRGFDVLAVPDGYAVFDSALETVACTAATPIYVNCVKCRHVTADEHNLLHAIGALQAERPEAARNVLREWLPPAAVRLMLPHLAHFAAAFRDHGYPVPVREKLPRGLPPGCPDEAPGPGPDRPTLH